MANFITRFELEKGTNTDYSNLKRLAERAGFTKIIKSDDEVPYYLPLGTYLASTERDKNHILEVAINVAKRLGRKYKILVTKSDGSAWVGLDRA